MTSSSNRFASTTVEILLRQSLPCLKKFLKEFYVKFPNKQSGLKRTTLPDCRIPPDLRDGPELPPEQLRNVLQASAFAEGPALREKQNR